MTQPVQTEQPPDPGEELQKQLQYIRLWRVSVRLEYASLAAIAVFVLLEKVLPFGARAGRVTGGLLVLAGLLVLFQA